MNICVELEIPAADFQRLVDGKAEDVEESCTILYNLQASIQERRFQYLDSEIRSKIVSEGSNTQ